MNDLSPEARALLRAARNFDDPSDTDVRRVRTSVLVKVGAVAGLGGALTAAKSSVAASPGAFAAGTIAKVGAAMLVVGGLATGAYVAGHSPRPAGSARAAVVQSKSVATAGRAVTAPAIAEESTPAVSPNAVEEPPARPVPAPRARPAARANDRVSRASRPEGDLEGEARLLEQADADLRQGDPEAALARLAEHAVKFPTGALREERDAVRIVALCRAGRVTEGKIAAERFLARSPRSALATRIRAACGLARAGE